MFTERTQQQTAQILNVFDQFRMPTTAIDEYDKGGREVLGNRIAEAVSRNETVQFYMLGFPFKSTNHRDKTLGVTPDLAEEVALQNFGKFHGMVAEVYKPGAKITVLSDGFIFNDLMQEPDSVVHMYKEITEDWATSNGAEIIDLTQLYRKSMSLSTMRGEVMRQFGISPQELQARILTDPNVNALYRGMMHFMEEDLAVRGYTSRNQLNKAAKLMTKEMMMRNEAYSQLGQAEFGRSHIRLSMHHSTNNGTKYSFQLIPSERAWTSPWHCALLLEDGQYVTVHRKDAEAAGYELVYKNGTPWYYQGNCTKVI